MAKIVLGLGTAHSTQCSVKPEWWAEHAKLDRKRTPYERLEANAPAWMPGQLTDEVWNRKYEATQSAIATLGRALKDAAPDVLVVVGDDQHELFLDDCLPAFSVFMGPEIWDLPGSPENLAPSHRAGRWAVHADEPDRYACEPALARWMVRHLIDAEFDVAQFTRQPEGRSLGHAWTFVKRRLMTDMAPIPMVPVLINTYFPPNQPTPKRCYALGQAIRAAVESWPDDRRVAIVASGGLSHFVIDEELDRTVIKALADKDADTLRNLPMDKLQSGSSEILNWVVAAGALEDKRMELVDYVPGYRSSAGTGCGMTFATWS